VRLARAAPAPIPSDATPATATLLAAIARYTRNVYRLRRGNAVRLLRGGGEAFPAMLAAIDGAQRSVVLEMYTIDDDATGRRFLDALAARAAAGVAVRLIFDALGSVGLDDDHVARLHAAGVEVLAYHPIAPWRKRFNLSHRDHRKLLVVDDAVGFAGGLNLSDDYAAVADGGRGWHDVHAELRGPVVADLARLFRRTWLREGGRPYPAPPAAERRSAEAMNVAARIVDNSRARRRGAIRRAYVTAIRAATRSVLLENAYFLPDRRLRVELVRAVRRGVEVTVIVPGRSDVRAVEWAGLYIHRRLAARGVRVLHWTGPMMHAKTAVVDATWSTIGSFNFDARSLRYNLEVVVEIIDPELGAQLEQRFREDQLGTVPFDEQAWVRLPWWKQALAWLAYRFRAWL